MNWLRGLDLLNATQRWRPIGQTLYGREVETIWPLQGPGSEGAPPWGRRPRRSGTRNRAAALGPAMATSTRSARRSFSSPASSKKRTSVTRCGRAAAAPTPQPSVLSPSRTRTSPRLGAPDHVRGGEASQAIVRRRPPAGYSAAGGGDHTPTLAALRCHHDRHRHQTASGGGMPPEAVEMAGCSGRRVRSRRRPCRPSHPCRPCHRQAAWPAPSPGGP